jgi:hypothetical protein
MDSFEAHQRLIADSASVSGFTAILSPSIREHVPESACLSACKSAVGGERPIELHRRLRSGRHGLLR